MRPQISLATNLFFCQFSSLTNRARRRHARTYLQCRDGSHGHVASQPPARRHDVNLVSVVGVKVRDDITRVDGVHVQIVIVVVTVVHAVIDVNDEGDEPRGKGRKVHGLGAAQKGL